MSKRQPGRLWVMGVGLLLAVAVACEAGSGGHVLVREPIGPLPQCPEPVCPEPICPKIDVAEKTAAEKAAAKKTAAKKGLAPTPEGPLDLNTATAEELDGLPGVGRATAERIMNHRSRRPFRSPRDLMRVRGIGPSKYRDLKPLVTVKK